MHTQERYVGIEKGGSIMEIVLKDVMKVIQNNTVLDHITWEFHSGKIYGLRGYNGSGKTMLLRVICGLIRPTKGQVFIDNKQLGKDMDYPQSLGILIENPAFLNDQSAFNNLKMIAELNNRIGEKEIREVLNKVGLADKQNIRYRKFSLGMKQRLGIAAAIMEKPEILLLDEPTNALDEDGIQMVSRIIREMRSENRIVIVASHEKEWLQEITDEVLIVENGRLKESHGGCEDEK